MTKAKTMDAKIKDIEHQISMAEAAAELEIMAIAEACEERTGRKLVLSSTIEMELPPLPTKKNHTLRHFVGLTARTIREGWDFNTPCEFWDWAEPIFKNGWDK